MYGLQKGSELTEAFVETHDRNIIDWYVVQKSELYLNKLQQQIDSLQQQIDTMPKLIQEYPPGVSDEIKKAIDQWNEAAIASPVAELERQKTELEDLKAKAVKAEPAPFGGM